MAELQRVKVYRLNEEGLWDDKGTGHVTVEVVEVRGGAALLGRHSPRSAGTRAMPTPRVISTEPCRARDGCRGPAAAAAAARLLPAAAGDPASLP